MLVPLLVACLAVTLALALAALRLDRNGDTQNDEIEKRFVALGEELGNGPKDGEIVALIDGRSFTLRLRSARGGKYDLEIETPIGEGPDRLNQNDRTRGRLPVVVRRETWIDRLGKRLFINREVQTGDAAFDEAGYVESDAPDADVERVLSRPSVRSEALGLLERGFVRVTIDEGKGHVACSRAAGDAKERLDLAEIREVCRVLGATAAAVPLPPDGSRAPSAWLAGPLTGVLSALAAFAGFYLTTWARDSYYPLSRGATLFGLGLGLLVWVVVIPVVGAIVRGRSVSFRLFGACFALLLVALPLMGIGVTVGLNGRMDQGEPLLHTTRVRSKGSRTYRGGTLYYVRIEGLTDPAAELELPVERDVFSGVSEGERVVVEVGRGRFGWEWLKGIRHGG